MGKRLHRQKHKQDPFVDLYVEYLQAVVEERGWTPSRLANEIEDSQQTIDAMLKDPGPTRKCRASRVRNIADALDVSYDLLTGGQVVWPDPPLLPPTFEFLYSPRTERAASRLLTKVKKAAVRDVQAWTPGDEGISPNRPPDLAMVSEVVNLVSDSITVGEWRWRFLKRTPKEWEASGHLEPRQVITATGEVRAARDPSHEKAILALICAVEHILKPWFAGRAFLNFRALSDFGRFHRTGPLPVAHSPTDMADVFSWWCEEQKAGVPRKQPSADSSNHPEAVSQSSVRRKK